MEVQADAVLAAMQRRINSDGTTIGAQIVRDALTIAIQAVRIDQLEIEATQLRAVVAERQSAPVSGEVA